MKNVTDRTRNPFGMTPDCPASVPGFGDANADFHVVGDHPGVHGGTATGVPFTGEPWSSAFLEALAEAGLIRSIDDGKAAPAGTTVDDPTPAQTTDGGVSTPSHDGDDPFVVDRTFLSYLHMCVSDGEPTEDDYAGMEPFFDAELRAIAAHVLLPVGRRATEHVLEEYTARARSIDLEMDALHGTEIRGSGWLVVPVKDPREWTDSDAERLVAGLRELRRTDYRRVTDLGRFIAGDDPYLVR
ncbi:uracil-DNA glycosylase family protein [Halopenitus salinus]|uniref:Uracil-DNA glycosylase family protein n=1 Tax=Halopenitus salinus TaxID=1198295 RepID=A0ABD5UZY7_9EURY